MYCPWTGKPIVDMDIYTKHRQFKLPGSSKAGSNRQLPLPTRDFLKKCRIIDRRGDPDFTAEDLGITSSVLRRFRGLQKPADGLPSTLNLPQQKIRQFNTNQTERWGLSHNDIVKYIETLLRRNGDNDTKVCFRNGRYCGRNGPSGRKCLVAGEHNESDNCFFHISDGEIHYVCFDAESHPFCASKIIGTLPRSNESFIEPFGGNSKDERCNNHVF